jgi:hypothetical protein
MNDRCQNCGSGESEAVANGTTLGLSQEFQSGIYTCCQLATWAHEQWCAWVETTYRDFEGSTHQVDDGAEITETEAMLVPVRFRQRVPWFRCASRLPW